MASDWLVANQEPGLKIIFNCLRFKQNFYSEKSSRSHGSYFKTTQYCPEQGNGKRQIQTNQDDVIK